MNIYAKRVLEALPGTLDDLMQRTQFGVRYILSAIIDLRAEGHRVTAVAHPGERTEYMKGGTDEA